MTPTEQIGVGAVRISELEKRYVNEVLDTSRLSYGPFSKRLEAEFARQHGCRYCIFTNSGTSSLQIAVEALKEQHAWQDGDEVLCPAATFVATSNVLIQSNLTPVFVDVEADTYNLDPTQIERHITPRTRALMVAHLYGQPSDMDPIMRIAGKHDLRVIEDSAETMFAKYRGRSVGGFGDIACFSTYACHVMVTGVGGLTTTNDADLAVILRSLMNHGRDNIYISMDDDPGKTGEELREIVGRRFSFVRNGFSYRCTEMEAALGVGQIEQAPTNLLRRRAVAEQLLAGLAGHADYLQLPHRKNDRDHSYMMFPLLVAPDAPFTREDITLYLEERLIETRTMVTLLNQPYYRRIFGEGIEDRYPVAQRIGSHGFYIGSHPEMSDETIAYVLATFDEFFAHGGD
jgi:dTDP-4-amino-4,6-dideoxygalactose transaminase